MDADLIESYFKAHGIETELIQEAYEHFMSACIAERVQILVPNYQLDEAQKLYEGQAGISISQKRVMKTMRMTNNHSTGGWDG